MKIKMLGIDYKCSKITVREKFAITKEQLQPILKGFCSESGVHACVIISTCNRTEVYVSMQDEVEISLQETLCKTLNQDAESNEPYFIIREENEAIEHLCLVASGTDSQILGDDQIITQVREAIELSREYGFCDSYLETFFKTAITAAKKIKTNVILRDIKNSSAPHRTVEILKTSCDLKKQEVLVIGNGKMGRLVAELLLKEGAGVTITLREYRKGNIEIPVGAKTVNYSQRYEVLKNCTVAISATTSPHNTITYEECKKLKHLPSVFVDLAIPRDIETSVETLQNIKLFTIDDLGDKHFVLSTEKKLQIRTLVLEQIENYFRWKSYKLKNELSIQGV